MGVEVDSRDIKEVCPLSAELGIFEICMPLLEASRQGAREHDHQPGVTRPLASFHVHYSAQ